MADAGYKVAVPITSNTKYRSWLDEMKKGYGFAAYPVDVAISTIASQVAQMGKDVGSIDIL